MRAPAIKESTEEERRQYIKCTFKCIADCDMCGLCVAFRGKDPEVAYDDIKQTLYLQIETMVMKAQLKS